LEAAFTEQTSYASYHWWPRLDPPRRERGCRGLRRSTSSGAPTCRHACGFCCILRTGRKSSHRWAWRPARQCDWAAPAPIRQPCAQDSSQRDQSLPIVTRYPSSSSLGVSRRHRVANDGDEVPASPRRKRERECREGHPYPVARGWRWQTLRVRSAAAYITADCPRPTRTKITCRPGAGNTFGKDKSQLIHSHSLIARATLEFRRPSPS
jgi:hypothetical protein